LSRAGSTEKVELSSQAQEKNQDWLYAQRLEALGFSSQTEQGRLSAALRRSAAKSSGSHSIQHINGFMVVCQKEFWPIGEENDVSS